MGKMSGPGKEELKNDTGLRKLYVTEPAGGRKEIKRNHVGPIPERVEEGRKEQIILTGIN